MENEQALESIVIGQGRLTRECLDIWQDRGHKVTALITKDADCLRFANLHNILTFPPRLSGEHLEQLRELGCDYLLSIINPQKVSTELLRMPRELPINYHDGPLPRYAGLHVTSWAVQQQEQDYGVTWHVMSGEFDAGDILLQKPVAIANDDTAFSLSLKCHEQGLAGFGELVAQLESKRLTPTTQQLADRTVFLSSARAENLGILDFERSATELSAIVRGLNFGEDANPLGSAKFRVGNDWFLPRNGEALEPATGTAEPSTTITPGGIERVDADGIVVQTGDGNILLSGLRQLNGDEAPSSHIVGGKNIQLLERSELTRLAALDQQQRRDESFWVHEYLETTPVDPFPAVTQTLGEVNTGTGDLAQLDLPAALIEAADQAFGALNDTDSERQTNSPDYLLALYCYYLQRLSPADAQSVGLATAGDATGLFTDTLPFRLQAQSDQSVLDVCRGTIAQWQRLAEKGTHLIDLWARQPSATQPKYQVLIQPTSVTREPAKQQRSVVTVTQSPQSMILALGHEVDVAAAQQHWLQFQDFVQNCMQNLQQPVGQVSLLSQEDRERQLVTWNATQVPLDATSCVQNLIDSQIQQRGDQVALVFRGDELTYQELGAAAAILAQEIADAGVAPGDLVGIHLDRSLEMVVAMLAILRLGAAYIPLDPSYPSDRIAHMVRDSQLPVTITSAAHEQASALSASKKILVDGLIANIKKGATATNFLTSNPCLQSDLAYVIYTSGSTGLPKGVMIEHGNLNNFLVAMDQVLDFKEPGVWMAVTSMSFDISVLELLWTLARGFKVVIAQDVGEDMTSADHSTQPMDVSLFYFSSDAGPDNPLDRYKLLLEGTKFADQHGFSAVWTPERHFHLFGGLYPNPSVISAALAAVTDNIAIRAGSIVLPLHNPVRVAEEWSVVDNLSNGRVGFSFASGWHANDFVLAPDNYANRKQLMFDGIETVRKLWAGETLTMANGEGQPAEVKIYPPPIQSEPPIWVTTAGNIETFMQAGEGGFNLLTNLLGQSIDELETKLAAYREGRRKAGHDGPGQVSVMVHTFVGEDVEEVREIVRGPFSDYLKTSFDLVKIAPWAFPAFSQPSKAAAQDASLDATNFTDEDLDALVDHAFERYFHTAGIFGTPEHCLKLVNQLKAAGVNEVACLIDFGVDSDLVLENLPHLATLHRLSNVSVPATTVVSEASESDADSYSFAAQLQRHQVTHLQCTPSHARLLSSDQANVDAMRSLDKLLLGGEALPEDLANTMANAVRGKLINVYGPTETTIWSTSKQVDAIPGEPTIGRPIANTQIYILDSQLHPQPIGSPGELWIGGLGVVRGYLHREELTAERFVPNPFRGGNERMYRTGDLAAWTPAGDIRFLGRLDHQIKLRGYRIELGEIETVINASDQILESVVVALPDESGNQKLVGYLVPASVDASVPASASSATVGRWQSIWDETYKVPAIGSDKLLDTSGWRNSFTGEPHPEAEMAEWANTTVSRIHMLRPKRLLELGCGTGMLLYRLAADTQVYTGVDLSETALANIQQHCVANGLDQVNLIQGAADSFVPVAGEQYDTLVINSVAQYFPNLEYFESVLRHVLPLLSPNAKIFLGDVRNSQLLTTFHSAIYCQRAAPDTNLQDLKAAIQDAAENDAELLFAPAYFLQLGNSFSRVKGVNLQLKQSTYLNEMSVYRYDVALQLDQCDIVPTSQTEVYQGPTDSKSLISAAVSKSSWLRLTGLTNARTSAVVAQEKALGNAAFTDASQLLAKYPAATSGKVEATRNSLDPNQLLVDLVAAGGYAEATPGSTPDTFDLVFRGNNDALYWQPTQAPLIDARQAAHEPKAPKRTDALLEHVQSQLQKALPEFMVPADFVVLESMPLTPNGKIDRQALPKPERRTRRATTEFMAPQSDLEQTLADIMRGLLNLETIGTRDNFFDVGANSLLIVQANNRLNQTLPQKVSLVSMYRFPTVESLAKHLGGEQDSAAVDQGSERGSRRKAALKTRKRRTGRR